MQAVGAQESGTYYFSVRRTNSSFEFKTAPVNSSTDIESWTMRWSYPSSKPSDMSQAEYDNIGIMITRTNRVGFGVRSMETTFYIDKQYEIFDDGDIMNHLEPGLSWELLVMHYQIEYFYLILEKINSILEIITENGLEYLHRRIQYHPYSLRVWVSYYFISYTFCILF
jgi:hypothetical protein